MDKFMEHTSAIDDNATEQARLEGQHEVVIHNMGKPIYAPVDFSKAGLRILDSGCANGRWLRDLKGASPAKHEYVGTDVVPLIFPANPPDDMSFHVHDIKNDWPTEMQGTFDLVHERFVMAGAAPGSPKPVVGRLASLLKPGGWLQLIEMDVDAVPESNGPETKLMWDVFRTMFYSLGLGNIGKELKAWMEDAGLTNVQEEVVYLKMGAKIEDKSLKQKSIDSPACALPAILAVVKAMPNAHSFTDEQLDGLEGRLRKELDEQGGINRIHVVWGQK